jgi:hypothetical protein
VLKIVVVTATFGAAIPHLDDLFNEVTTQPPIYPWEFCFDCEGWDFNIDDLLGGGDDFCIEVTTINTFGGPSYSSTGCVVRSGDGPFGGLGELGGVGGSGEGDPPVGPGGTNTCMSVGGDDGPCTGDVGVDGCGDGWIAMTTIACGGPTGQEIIYDQTEEGGTPSETEGSGDDSCPYGCTPEGRPYGPHMDDHPERHIPGWVIDDVIDNGDEYPDSKGGGGTQYYDSENNVTVFVNSNEEVVAARHGLPEGM